MMVRDKAESLFRFVKDDPTVQSLPKVPEFKVLSREVTVTEYYGKCPVCSHEIKDPSEKRVWYNLQMHCYQKRDPKHLQLYERLKKEREE